MALFPTPTISVFFLGIELPDFALDSTPGQKPAAHLVIAMSVHIPTQIRRTPAFSGGYSVPAKVSALTLARRPTHQTVAKVLELVECRVADAKLALLPLASANLDRKPESLAQLSFGRLGIGVLAPLPFWFVGAGTFRQGLDV